MDQAATIQVELIKAEQQKLEIEQKLNQLNLDAIQEKLQQYGGGEADGAVEDANQKQVDELEVQQKANADLLENNSKLED